MADPQAMAKLRAVLDYIPEEAARRLPGDPQDYYDALTRRMHRTVAVKSLVRRRVIVEAPDLAEGAEPEAPAWIPPAPEPEEPEPEVAMAEASSVVVAEESPVAEAIESAAATVEAGPSGEEEADDFFDVVKGEGGASEMRPVEPDVSLSESEWRNLETSELPEETAEAPSEAGAEASADEAFEEILLPAEGSELPPEAAEFPTEQAVGEMPPAAPPETAVAEPQAVAEFEVEEEAEVAAPNEFEILEEEEADVVEGEEPPYQINEFTLYRRDVRAKGGRTRSTYFFAAEPPTDAAPSPLPEGYEAIVNESTGVPVVRKSTARVLPLVDIEGLGPVMAERLERAGVRTTKDLLVIDVRQVSEETGVSERLLRNFRAMADLLQLQGLKPAEAAALVYAGVRGLDELLKDTPTELAKRMNTAAKDYNLSLKSKATSAKVKAWQDKLRKQREE